MSEYGKIHTDGSRSGGQPVIDSLEAKARDMVRKEDKNGLLNFDAAITALCRAIERHEAYQQKVNDIAAAYNQMAFTVSEPHLSGYRVIIGFDKHADASVFHDRLVSLLDFLNPKPKPDPLVDVAKSLGYFNTVAQHWAGDVRAALEARGLEIREKGQ